MDDLTFSVSSVRGSRRAAAAGVAAGIAIFAVLGIFGELDAGALAISLVFFWLLGRIAYFTLVGASEAAGPRSPEIQVDLLDLRPLARFGRIGLRLALGWIGGVSIFTVLYFLFAFFGEPAVAWAAVFPVYVATLAVATLALLIPVRGVRDRIR